MRDNLENIEDKYEKSLISNEHQKINNFLLFYFYLSYENSE